MLKLSGEEKTLLRLQGLYFFTDALAGVFINIFLYTLGGFRAAILFNLIAFICLLVWYIVSGWELKRFSSKTLVRFGLLCKATNYGLLFLLREHSLQFIVLLGIISGTGIGHFWSGMNLTLYNLTHRETRSKYFGWFGSLSSLAQSLGPIIGGGIIAAAAGLTFSKIIGYAFLFLIVLLLTLVNLFNIRLLPAYTRVQYSPAHLLRHRRTRNWNLVLVQQFCIGLWDASFSVVSGILIYLIVQGELGVGMVNTVSALLYAGTSIWVGTVLHRKPRLLFIGIIGMPLGILLFALQQNWLGVLALVIATGIATPLLNISAFVAFFNTMDETKEAWQAKYHMLIERETALDLPRIAMYLVLFFFFTAGDHVQIARQWLLMIAIVPAIVGVLSLFLHNRLQRTIRAEELLPAVMDH